MTDLAITSAIESNYQGMIAMVGADHRVYLGKPENCYLSPEGMPRPITTIRITPCS